MKKFYAINIKKHYKILFLSLTLSCHVWSLNPDQEAYEKLQAMLKAIAKLDQDAGPRLLARLKEIFAESWQEKKGLHPYSEERKALLRIAEEYDRENPGANVLPELKGNSLKMLKRYFNDITTVAGKKPKPQAVSQSHQEVSKEFVGLGQLLCPKAEETGNDAADDNKILYEKLSDLQKKFRFEDSKVQAVKNAGLEPAKIRSLIDSLNSKKNPREGHQAFDKFYADNIGASSAKNNAKPTISTPSNTSKPRVGADGDEKKVLTLEDFLKLGKKNGIPAGTIKEFFEEIQKAGKLWESHGFLEGLTPTAAKEYVNTRLASAKRDSQKEQADNSAVNEIDKHIKNFNASPADRVQVRELALKLLDRTELANVNALLNITQLLAGMYQTEEKDFQKLSMKLVSGICLAFADSLAVKNGFGLKDLIQFSENLRNYDVRRLFISCINDSQNQGRNIEDFIKEVVEKLIEKNTTMKPDEDLELRQNKLREIAQLLVGSSDKRLEKSVVDNLCLVIAEKNIPLSSLEKFYEALKKDQIRNGFITWINEKLESSSMNDFVDTMIELFLKPGQKTNEANMGLCNSFNNCYLNSVMQIMAQLPGFVFNIEQALKAEYSAKLESTKTMHQFLSKFFAGMRGERENFDSNANPASDKLRHFLRQNGDADQDNGQQQDAQETFSAILNKSIEGQDEMAKDFQFVIEYTDTPMHEGMDSDEYRREVEGEARERGFLGPDENLAPVMQKTESTTLLSLELGSDDVVDLYSCLANFLREEEVDLIYWTTLKKQVDDQPRDIQIDDVGTKEGVLGNSVKAKRTKRILKMPKVLAVHLKSYNEVLEKKHNSVLFPLILDTNVFMKEDVAPQPYNLIGTIFHGGPSIHSGHYWSFVKNLVTKEYYLYNDKIKQTISKDDMLAIGNTGMNQQADVEGTPYMLFFEMQ